MQSPLTLQPPAGMQVSFTLHAPLRQTAEPLTRGVQGPSLLA
jgi:hypothetical protein